MSKYILGHRAQTRTRSIRYTLLVAVLLILVAVLQVTLFSRFRLFGAVPDLMICTVLCLAFFCGKYVGAVSGIGAGFLIEAIGSQGITLLPICYMLLGYIMGHYARTVLPRSYPAYLPYLAVTLVFRAAITFLYACMNYANINLPQILLQSVLPELAVTAIAGCILYFPLMLFCGWLEKKIF
ncbi:MAG: rod shape-determining protein MreD [Clostridia bacterium]|nr:rod shape-determining protein MreD [Clostridia bacterium]